MVATILAWLVYGAFVALRPTGRIGRATWRWPASPS